MLTLIEWWDALYVYPHIILYWCKGLPSILEEFNYTFFIRFCKFGVDSSAFSNTSCPFLIHIFFFIWKKIKMHAIYEFLVYKLYLVASCFLW